MSSGYVAQVREDPGVVQARAQFAQCQHEHARLSALAQRHASKTGAAFAPRTMTTALAGGQAAIASATNAKHEVEALRRTVVGLATTAYEIRLRSIVGVTPAVLAVFELGEEQQQATATARTGPVGRIASASDVARLKATREAAGHIRLLHDAMEVPERLSELAVRIANTENTGARNQLLHELKRDAGAYRSYALLAARGNQQGDEMLTALVSRARRQLDAGQIDDAMTTLRQGMDQADSLEEAAARQSSEDYVRRTLAEILDGIGGALDGVTLGAKGMLVRWPKAHQASAVATVRRPHPGQVEVKIEPVHIDGAAARVTEAGAAEEKEFCESLPALEAQFAPRLAQAGLVITSSKLHAPKNPSGAAAIDAAFVYASQAIKANAKAAQRGGGNG